MSGGQRVVFVASLTRSGSTVLGFLLATAPEAIVLGEVVPLLRTEKLWDPERVCSCGEPVDSCPYWGSVKTRLDAGHRERPVGEKYGIAIEVFRDVFGPGAILVDTSKSLRQLTIVRSVPGSTLSAIHLIRDVRSWRVSRRNVDRREGTETWKELVRVHGVGALTQRLRRSSMARALLWYRGNRNLERRIRDEDSRCTLGYEELAHVPDLAAEHLNARIDLDIPRPVDLSASTHHVALGNLMRLNPRRTSEIVYDYRWLAEPPWSGAVLMPWVMSYNRRTVYGNVSSFHGSGRRGSPE